MKTSSNRHASALSLSLLASLPEPEAAAMEPPLDLLREQTASRLPTYRHVDLQKLGRIEPLASALAPSPIEEVSHKGTDGLNLECPRESRTTKSGSNPQQQHRRSQSTTSSSSPAKSQQESNSLAALSPTPKLLRSLTFPTNTDTNTDTNTNTNATSVSHTTSASTPTSHLDRNSANLQPPRPLNDFESPKANQPRATRRVHPATAASSRNNKHNGPPLSMITQGFYDSHALEADSTTNWVAQHSMSLTPTSTDQPPSAAQQSSPSGTETPSARPLIKPIRGFKPSSRKSLEMNSRRTSRDPDDTLRALDAFEDSASHRNSNSHQQHAEQDEQTASDESDLFLRAAREEEKSARQTTNNSNANSPSRSDSRRSRAGQRSSLQPSSVSHPPISRRRGSDQESSNGVRPVDGQESVAQALTYRPTAKDRPIAPEDMNRTRYFNNSRSNPTTPRTFSSREISPESQASSGPRRPSAPDANLPIRTSYRQSNLSYTTPRTYNSSPLVSRSTDMHEVPETPRAAEGTESSVSTTAPSTVWDELEDLKSRIHRLELTGKMPPTAGAAMSRASNDRPPTATTTVTTLSSSPKRGRGNSISQEEHASTEPPPAETHPLLRAALTKAKPVLGPEIYKALEAAASDALAIASMMGSSGQPGPLSSSQSTIGGPPIVSDRQVRRKADSMCRSLTELCLAFSEAKPEITTTAPDPVSNPAVVRTSNQDSNDVRLSIEPVSNQRQLLTSAKSSPRALSRLEARRSSLLATSTLPNPRYAPSELGIPTQTGRRTSLFLRTRRAGTEEPEEEDETRFRAPSRATTEVGRLKQSPREYTSQQPLLERSLTIQSSLPVRRHYASTSLTNTVPPSMPPVSSLGGRRYLERSTPERDTASVVSRLAESRLIEDRGQRKSSIGQGYVLGRTGSLTRKTRQPMESPSAGQAGNYQ